MKYLIWIVLVFFISCSPKPAKINPLPSLTVSLKSYDPVTGIATLTVESLGLGIKEFGFVFSSDVNNPDISNSPKSIISETAKEGDFDLGLNLEENTSYFIRAYAINIEDRVSYSNPPIQVSIVDSKIATGNFQANQDHITGTIQGEILQIGIGRSIVNYGHCWSSAGIPTLQNSGDNITSLGTTSIEKTFISNVDNYELGVSNYIRAYARDSEGNIIYGDEIDTFKVFDFWLPVSVNPNFEGRSNPLIVKQNSLIYIIGGFGGDQSSWEFDASNQSWFELNSWFSYNIRNVPSFCLENITYAQGPNIQGNENYSKFYKVTSNGGTIDFTSLASLPDDRAVGMGVSIESIKKGYFIGGVDPWGGTWERNVYEYDLVNNIWTEKNPFPVPNGNGINGGVTFTLNDSAYVGLGVHIEEDINSYYKEFWVYNPSLDSWTVKNIFPGANRSSPVSWVLNGKAYVGTGSSSFTSLKDFWKYDPVTNKWEEIAELPGAPRSGAIAFVSHGNAYVGAGSNGSGYLNDFWMYVHDKEE